MGTPSSFSHGSSFYNYKMNMACSCILDRLSCVNIKLLCYFAVNFDTRRLQFGQLASDYILACWIKTTADGYHSVFFILLFALARHTCFITYIHINTGQTRRYRFPSLLTIFRAYEMLTTGQTMRCQST